MTAPPKQPPPSASVPPLPPLPPRGWATEPVTTWAMPSGYDWRLTTFSDDRMRVSLLLTSNSGQEPTTLPCYIEGVDPRCALYFLRLIYAAVTLRYLPDTYPAILMLDTAALTAALTKPPFDGYKFAGPPDRIVRTIEHLLVSEQAYAKRFRQNLKIALGENPSSVCGYNFADTRMIRYLCDAGRAEYELLVSFSSRYPDLTPAVSFASAYARAFLRASIFPSLSWPAVIEALQAEVG